MMECQFKPIRDKTTKIGDNGPITHQGTVNSLITLRVECLEPNNVATNTKFNFPELKNHLTLPDIHSQMYPKPLGHGDLCPPLLDQP